MIRRTVVVATAILAVAGGAWAAVGSDAVPTARDPQTTSSAPPPKGGYFRTSDPGTWRDLPSGADCADLVHRSTWEPRPLNAKRNGIMPNADDVHAAFAARPRSDDGSYRVRWDSWMLQRVDGAFTGTTDEIFQWAACKWGLRDNVLRAIAVRESTWYQYPTYPSGQCVVNWGCGDIVPSATRATRKYCRGLTDSGGYDYEADFGRGICPKTFSIAGVMSWQDPAWGRYPGNQNGTFPFNRDSTAFAIDYLAGELRGCYEGWELWLRDAGTERYAPGDLWGCVGAWYAGEWRTKPADGYVKRVRRALRNTVWLRQSFADTTPPCDKRLGCPVEDPLPARAA